MTTEIKDHHKRAIAMLVQAYEKDSRFPAIIIGGSVAKKCARDDSDVDFMIVATDEEYTQRQSQGDLFINRTDLCDYPGGYVDGKVVNMAYIHEVADHGNEPSRAAFDGAWVAYSRLGDLETIIKKINVFPEEGVDRRLRSFYSMAFIQNWLMGEAGRHGNIYTISRAASQLALFAGRLILAHNRVLYPYHKWFLQYLEKCKDKPETFMEDLTTLLKEPNSETAGRLFLGLQNFKDWGVSDYEAYMWFMTEVEWRWRKESPPLEDL